MSGLAVALSSLMTAIFFVPLAPVIFSARLLL
jgi:hypothetical protein